MDYEDGLLPDNDEVRFAVCDIIRKVKPDIIVTHHENSMHKDHIVCHRIVVDAWFYAAIEGFQRELPKHFAKKALLCGKLRMPPALSHTSMWT